MNETGHEILPECASAGENGKNERKCKKKKWAREKKRERQRTRAALGEKKKGREKAPKKPDQTIVTASLSFLFSILERERERMSIMEFSLSFALQLKGKNI